jgi:nucleoside phosphorylase
MRTRSESDAIALLAMMRYESDSTISGLMSEDLSWTIGLLSRPVRARVLLHAAVINAARSYDPEVAHEMLEQLANIPVVAARPVDFAIVTVKEPEFDAVKATFGVRLSSQPDFYFRGAYFYEVQVERTGRAPLAGVITKSGSAGSSKMAAFLHTVFSVYSPRLCCLVGMAGGHQRQVRLGDVVFGRKVVDFGRRIVTSMGEEIDLEPVSPDFRVSREMTSFRPARIGWSEAVADAVSGALRDDGSIAMPRSLDLSSFRPELKLKTIIASDEIVEDDSIPDRARRVGAVRRTGAVEMEGAGFAATCIESETPWLVMRGIADFGRAPRRRDWQFVSTVCAASATKLWLMTARFLD